jgi:hypothetical protein
MSFFGKLKGASAAQAAINAPAKKDLTAQGPTPLEKHLKDLTGPSRPDGSDKFFGFENVSLPRSAVQELERLIRITLSTVLHGTNSLRCRTRMLSSNDSQLL